MAETTNYQCPNCGGQLAFVGQTGKLHCEFCESDFTPAEVEAIYAERQAKADARAAKEKEANQQEAPQRPQKNVSAAEASMGASTRVNQRRTTSTDPIQAYLESTRWDDEDSQNLRAYNCSSCGAQLMVDQVTAVTSCPYCGNNAVLPGQLSDVLKPDLVIPFKLGKEDAVKALDEYYGGKKFLPDAFTQDNHIEEVQGVYVPFWLYSGRAKGDMHLSAERMTSWSDSENNYTRTDHYDLHRAGYVDFMRVPVDGSSRMPDGHMDAIEPYDYSELTDFSVAYLPGYLTDRYDLNVKECSPRAEKRAEATCTTSLESTVTDYVNVSVSESSTDVNWSDVSYALLPVWMLHTKWNGEDYLFAMNGQTGKLIGDLPIDNGKVVRRFFILFVPILVIIALIIQFVLGGFFA